MPTPMMFDVEESFNSFADASAMAEASRFKTIPSGSYQALVTKREGQYFELKQSKNGGSEYWGPVFTDSTEVSPDWRKGVKLGADVTNAEGKKLTTIRIEASWEAKRDLKSGKLDKLFTRWEQLVRAMYPNLKPEERAQKATGEVLTALSQYPVKVFLTESFQVPAVDGSKKWVSPTNEEEAKTYREAGYEVRNFLQSVQKI